jgi:hypothetical protein
MSVASVLERGGNVRDVSEVNGMRQIEGVWDQILPEQILEQLTIRTIEESILLQDFDPYPEEYTKLIGKYESELFVKDTNNLKRLTPSSFDNDNFFISINDFLHSSAAVKLLKRNITESTYGLRLANQRLKDIREFPGTSPEFIYSNIDFFMDYKLNYPSKDITAPIRHMLKQNPGSIMSWINSTQHGHGIVRGLHNLAYLKVLDPELFNYIDFSSTFIYKAGENQVKISLSKGLVNDAVPAAAHLKILASNRASISERGIELDMNLSLTPAGNSMPEIRRFDE